MDQLLIVSAESLWYTPIVMKTQDMYEVIVVNSLETDPAIVSQAVEKVIKEVSGEIKSVDAWGERKFAFPVGGKLIGNYTTYEVSLEKEVVEELKRLLRFEESILRSRVFTKNV